MLRQQDLINAHNTCKYMMHYLGSCCLRTLYLLRKQARIRCNLYLKNVTLDSFPAPHDNPQSNPNANPPTSLIG